MEVNQTGSVSVVIPCHNADKWIADAVESVRRQTHAVVEILVVDDASTDESAERVRAMGDGVQLIQGQWQNGNGARNAGLREVTREWVQFLDADDALKPDKISSQLAAAGNGVDVIVSPLVVRKEDASNGGARESVLLPTPGSDLIEKWLRWELCQTGAALWRTESLRRIGGWKEGLPCCQDNEVVWRALREGLEFAWVDTPGAIYRLWSEETVCRKDPRRVIRQKTELLDEALGWLEGQGRLNDGYRRIVGRACFEMARTWAKYNLDEATNYHRVREKQGLMRMEGPAAPASFQILAKLLGFGNAERIARLLR